jgi:hypothetical protein
MAGPLILTHTTEKQLRLRYDATNYTDFTTGIAGDLTIAPSGGDTSITGTLAVSSTLAVTGAVTGGTYNGQTISSAASLTGSLSVATTLAVTGPATLSGGATVVSATGGTIRLSRDDTGLAGSDVVGLIEFYSNDTEDANVNAWIKAIKDDGAVSGAPMGILFGTGTGGAVAERGRITSGGVLALGTSTTTSASAGETVIPIGKQHRAVNNAGTGTLGLIGNFSSGSQDNVLVGGSAALMFLGTTRPAAGLIADGRWWVEATGTSPSRTVKLVVRDGGSERTLATLTY